jgi:hypothetical protein
VPVYGYAAWRRVIFVAILLAMIVISMAPSVSEGTVIVRMYGSSSSTLLSHVYIVFSKVDLHEVGFPNSTGWVSITKGFSTVDLLSPAPQTASQTATAAQVHSGRYDAIAVVFSNATVVMSARSIPLAAPLPIRANVSLPVPPNGNGDVFLVIGFDYNAIFGNPPNLSLILVQVSTI